MNVSKYIFLNPNVLLEYIYNDSNLNGEPYSVLYNVKDQKKTFISNGSSDTRNTIDNQLFSIDPVTNKWGKVGSVDSSNVLQTNYPFLQLKNYPAGVPVRYDTIRIHLPVNYTFGEYLGFHLKTYVYDYTNTNIVEMSNFYFDISDVSQSYILGYTSPPLLLQEKLWGKNIEIQIPSPYTVSRQRSSESGTVNPNSINFNLTGGSGLSLNSPIFMDFQFINKVQTVNGITTYLLETKNTITVPQTPEFEKLGVKIQPSTQGDFFEVYGIYNGDIAEFNKFMNDSVQLGNRYYIQYAITLFEQNIRGKTMVITQTDAFNETIEYRPIIKYSTTTAIIDIEMSVIDAVDGSLILRRASYGMFSNELSKYSLYLKKINLRNVVKPKIYNQKSTAALTSSGLVSGGVSVETVNVPFPVLVDRFDVVCKSQSAQVGKDIYFGNNLLVIMIYPFDNIIQFQIAQNIGQSPNFLDMTSLGTINLVMKSDNTTVISPLYTETGEINLSIGLVTFKVSKSSYPNLKKIYTMKQNTFYITSNINNVESTIYTGFYKPFDAADNITQMMDDANNAQKSAGNFQSQIIKNPDSDSQETAIVTRVKKLISGTNVQDQVIVSPTIVSATSVMNNLTFALSGTSSTV